MGFCWLVGWLVGDVVSCRIGKKGMLRVVKIGILGYLRSFCGTFAYYGH